MSKFDLSDSASLKTPSAVPREEFEKFITALTHEIRNKLNTIALEAADLAEMAGPPPIRHVCSSRCRNAPPT